MRAQLASFHLDERGAALVELSLVLPVLLAIALGVFQFSYLIYNYHLITVGVRDAARYAAGATWTTQVQNNAICIAMTGQPMGTSCLPAATSVCTTGCRVSWWNKKSTITVSHVAVADDGTICGTGAAHVYCRGRDSSGNLYKVTVTANIPYSSIQSVNFLTFLGVPSLTLHISHEERDYNVR
jgi:Flp pilus assembly protein TadG